MDWLQTLVNAPLSREVGEGWG
ncbi:hypothetical protein CO2235_U560001 [Cupriavidus oxalaticus]|uniref:Uncharacterized protein n=1 Tax=Cupriavidus oxalaticus TaxID=96344 RepID=A0A375FNC4_9BURK|nr:hypothetical protein CO2235_U560001 [Cupriavidus oxalaticus]